MPNASLLPAHRSETQTSASETASRRGTCAEATCYWLWHALSHGAQRSARFLIGPAGGLSSAIFAKGTMGTPGHSHSQRGGPAPLGLLSACWECLRADTCGFGERVQRLPSALSGTEAGERRSRGVRDCLLILR